MTYYLGGFDLNPIWLPEYLELNFAGLVEVPLFYVDFVSVLNVESKSVKENIIVCTLDHIYFCHNCGDIIRCFPYTFISTMYVDQGRNQFAFIIPLEYDVCFMQSTSPCALANVVVQLHRLHSRYNKTNNLRIMYVKRDVADYTLEWKLNLESTTQTGSRAKLDENGQSCGNLNEGQSGQLHTVETHATQKSKTDAISQRKDARTTPLCTADELAAQFRREQTHFINFDELSRLARTMASFLHYKWHVAINKAKFITSNMPGRGDYTGAHNIVSPHNTIGLIWGWNDRYIGNLKPENQTDHPLEQCIGKGGLSVNLVPPVNFKPEVRYNATGTINYAFSTNSHTYSKVVWEPDLEVNSENSECSRGIEMTTNIAPPVQDGDSTDTKCKPSQPEFNLEEELEKDIMNLKGLNRHKYTLHQGNI